MSLILPSDKLECEQITNKKICKIFIIKKHIKVDRRTQTINLYSH